jgi:hypothetical protein
MGQWMEVDYVRLDMLNLREILIKGKVFFDIGYYKKNYRLVSIDLLLVVT